MLNLGKVYTKVNNVLTGLLGKYTSIRFIGKDEDNDNENYYLTPPITKGFYYRPTKLPEVGQIVDLLRIVPQDESVEEAIKYCTAIELKEPNGNFLRFSINSTKQPTPPSYQWILDIKPNHTDQSVITD